MHKYNIDIKLIGQSGTWLSMYKSVMKSETQEASEIKVGDIISIYVAHGDLWLDFEVMHVTDELIFTDTKSEQEKRGEL